jgi:hypothetical protein
MQVLTEYAMARRPTSRRSFHAARSLSTATASTKDCTVLRMHCTSVDSSLFGYSLSSEAYNKCIDRVYLHI